MPNSGIYFASVARSLRHVFGDCPTICLKWRPRAAAFAKPHSLAISQRESSDSSIRFCARTMRRRITYWYGVHPRLTSNTRLTSVRPQSAALAISITRIAECRLAEIYAWTQRIFQGARLDCVCTHTVFHRSRRVACTQTCDLCISIRTAQPRGSNDRGRHFRQEWQRKTLPPRSDSIRPRGGRDDSR